MNRTLFAINSVLFAVLISQQIKTNTSVTDQPKQQVQFKAPQLNAAPKPIEPQIQVNRLPHPFNVGGLVPYQVWVDGERLPLNSKKAKQIVKTLNLKFEQPENTREIHSGAGWLQPHNINQTQ